MGITVPITGELLGCLENGEKKGRSLGGTGPFFLRFLFRFF